MLNTSVRIHKQKLNTTLPRWGHDLPPHWTASVDVMPQLLQVLPSVPLWQFYALPCLPALVNRLLTPVHPLLCQLLQSLSLVSATPSTVVWTRWAAVDWSRPKKWNWCMWADLHLKNKKKRRRGLMSHRTFPKKFSSARKRPPLSLTPPNSFHTHAFHSHSPFLLFDDGSVVVPLDVRRCCQVVRLKAGKQKELNSLVPHPFFPQSCSLWTLYRDFTLPPQLIN